MADQRLAGASCPQLFNDHLGFEVYVEKERGKTNKPPLPKPLDIAALKRSAEPRAKALVAYLLALARAQACEMMGERGASPTSNGRSPRPFELRNAHNRMIVVRESQFVFNLA